MGVMSRLFGTGDKDSNGGNADSGNHAINRSQVFNPGGGFSPTNPGNFSKIQRTIPRLEDPRYFRAEVADVLEIVKQDKKEELKHTKRAYKAMKDVEDTDTAIQEIHADYKAHVSNNELKRQQTEFKYARHLHGQRPKYAQLGYGLDRLDLQTNERINAIRNKLANV